ncbi:hypothetical protein COLO4_01252 [Corchorus olitorius]|uniref:Uncharacterized protein n=1 Tax=Corchorus olitorius TaxID=93759 RepID=A0A1R3L2S0_9ROSI|nr:hypothetical protein COLO4_01252 [Corchorus olitorius]
MRWSATPMTPVRCRTAGCCWPAATAMRPTACAPVSTTRAASSRTRGRSWSCVTTGRRRTWAIPGQLCCRTGAPWSPITSATPRAHAASRRRCSGRDGAKGRVLQLDDIPGKDLIDHGPHFRRRLAALGVRQAEDGLSQVAGHLHFQGQPFPGACRVVHACKIYHGMNGADLRFQPCVEMAASQGRVRVEGRVVPGNTEVPPPGGVVLFKHFRYSCPVGMAKPKCRPSRWKKAPLGPPGGCDSKASTMLAMVKGLLADPRFISVRASPGIRTLT